jgi:hypothetical protein
MNHPLRLSRGPQTDCSPTSQGSFAWSISPSPSRDLVAHEGGGDGGVGGAEGEVMWNRLPLAPPTAERGSPMSTPATNSHPTSRNLEPPTDGNGVILLSQVA